MTDDEREYVEERAAIREFEAGLSRTLAERLAYHDLAHRTPARPNPERTTP